MDGLDSTAGIVALAAGAIALIALLVAASALVRLRRLRQDQLALLDGNERGDLVEQAAVVTRRVSSLERALQAAVDDLVGRADSNAAELQSSIAHTAVVRYDALSEGSGRQSSSIALLDRAGRGVVVSSIHQRDQARVYAKPLERWESEYDLSPEEQEAIDAARGRGSEGRP